MEVGPKKGLLIGATLVVAGILITAWKANRILDEISTYRWNQTIAEMQSADFFTEVRSGSGGSKANIIYFGDFTYSYKVQDIEYVGSSYDLKGGMRTGSEGEARKLEDYLVSTKSFPLYYEPVNPSKSVMKKGISEDSSVRIAFSTFLMLIGVVVVRYQLKRTTEQAGAGDADEAV